MNSENYTMDLTLSGSNLDIGVDSMLTDFTMDLTIHNGSLDVSVGSNQSSATFEMVFGKILVVDVEFATDEEILALFEEEMSDE